MPNPADDFDSLIDDALKTPFEGWDFSYLEGRVTFGSLPWEYAGHVQEKMRGARAMLDMGTGGGERFLALAPFPERTCATECYAPNVPVARKRLEPLGVVVADTTADQENRHLPFQDGEFDLIVNRHECYVPEEVWRILKPGGFFLTQQCGGYGENDLIEWFKGKGNVYPMDWTAAVASGGLENAGFHILDVQEAFPDNIFKDVGAMVYYLRAGPWLVDDFSVEKYHDRLLAMHRHILDHGQFVTKDQRFFVEAVKPGVS